MKKVLLPILLLVAVPISAIAQTQEQKNIMDHIASLYTAQKWCSDYTVNLRNINLAGMSAKINPEKDPYRSYIRDKMRETEKDLSDAGTSSGCLALYVFYGPRGSVVSGQMMRK